MLYGPPDSVRSTVAPGTFASAAALTLAATSLESAVRCAPARVFAVVVLPLSAAPAIAAPPRPSAPRAATVTADLRIVVVNIG